MYLVLIGWLYVVLMMAVVEAASPQGTVLGAAITLLLYGALPIGILMYIGGTPARRRARRLAEQAQQEMQEDISQEAQQKAQSATPTPAQAPKE